MPTVAFAADDYGLSPGVSTGIRALLGQRRLTATSCMTIFPEWEREGRALAAIGPKADLGVHLTLTAYSPLGEVAGVRPGGALPGLRGLMWRAVSGGLVFDEVYDELRRQVDRFEDVMGQPPDHLDGHHHVQQLPVVRDAVVKLAAEHLDGKVWVRTCDERIGTILRRRVALGRSLAFAWMARGLAQRLDDAGIRRNAGFTGAYGFDTEVDYADRLSSFLLGAREGTVLMCHPGVPDGLLEKRDSLVGPRGHELAALASPGLDEVLAKRGVTLGRLSRIPQLTSR